MILAAGDIANCDGTGDEATAQLLDNLPGTVLTLGDNAYPDGTAQQFNDCYNPTWGRHKARTRPSPGNHDYHVPGAADYFAYFGSAAGEAGKGYYSFNLGAWHLIALNALDSAAGSVQEQWLRTDLAANPKTCVLAYWHYPRFNSGSHGNNTKTQPFWQALYDYGADVVLSEGTSTCTNGSRLKNRTGRADATRGLRELVVGTGGSDLYSFMTIQPNSQVRNNDTNGVLDLTLKASHYDWQFARRQGNPRG